jgi:Cu(I)/Ag(I) efflux system membrane protein CusA/SilA
MLTSGIKAPLALRISGPDQARIQGLAERAEHVLRTVDGVRSVFAERPGEGRFVEVRLDRRRAALYGISASDVTQLIGGAVGGTTAGSVSQGRERYPIVVRYPRDERGSVEAIRALRVRGAGGVSADLAQIADVRVVDGPAELPSENAQAIGYVLVDIAGGDVGGVLDRAQAAIARAHLEAPGCTLEWAGQYLRLRKASARLLSMAAVTLISVLVILYLHFRDWRRIGVVMASLPFAASGGVWLMWALGYRWSFAAAVGFLALAGVAAEFCVVMILYLDLALAERRSEAGRGALREAITQGALLRLRPKTMTVAVILGGLAPLMVVDGAGVDVIRRIAAPLVGGMITAPLYSLLVVPSVYWLALSRKPGCGRPPRRRPGALYRRFS